MHNRVVLQLNTIHYIIIIKTCIMHELLSLLSLLLLFRRYHYFCFCLYTAINLSKEIGFQEGISEAVELSIGNIATLEKTGDVQGAFRLAVSLKTIDFKVRYMCAHGPCGFRFPQHGRVLTSFFPCYGNITKHLYSFIFLEGKGTCWQIKGYTETYFPRGMYSAL